MQLEDKSDAPVSRRVSRLGLYLPVTLLALLALGWSGFWLYASRLAEQNLAAWRAAEAERGRAWTCDGQDIGGYPFRIELRCAAVRLALTRDARPVEATLGGLVAVTQIYAPKLVLADLTGPLRLQGAGDPVALDWTDMRASLRFGSGLERLSIVARQPKLAPVASAPVTSEAAAEAFELHLRADSARPAADRAVDFAVRVSKGQWRPLDDLFASPDPVDLDASGAMTQALDLRPHALAQVLEDWRMIGGALALDSLRFVKGGAQVDGKGDLSLDAAHRPAGQISVSATGLGPIFARFGGGGMGQIAGSLLSGGGKAPVQWPLRLQDGRIVVGPLRSPPILQPLY